MLRLFNINNGTIKEQSLPEIELSEVVAQAAWIDAHDPSDDERSELQAFLHTALPESDDVEEI